MDEETKKLLQNLAQQQARSAEAANMVTIDKKPFAINLHMIYGAIGVNILVAWTVIGWIKDVNEAVQKSRQAPAVVETVKNHVAATGTEIKELRRITSETDARITKQEIAVGNIQDAIRGLASDQAKVLAEIKDLKKDITRQTEKGR